MIPRILRNFFFRQKQQQKDCKQAEKNVTFCKNCCSGTGVYLESLSKILTIDLFLDKKIPKKDYVPGGKRRHI